MVDREKVIHGLNSCGNDDGHPDRCGRTECPYRDNGAWCTHELAHDAEVLVSELLKAQEQKPSEDWISRKRLKDEIQYYIDEAGWGEEANKVLGWCLEFIDNQHGVKWDD